MTSPLSAQVVINSVDVSSRLVSLERSEILENPGSVITLVFDSGLNFSAISPWQDTVIHEQGVLTFTGYVTHINVSRAPAQVSISARDTYLRPISWFIDSNLYTGGPDATLSTDKTSRNIDYYVTYLCNLCGISFSINDSAGSVYFIKSDTPLGLRTVSDALTELCTLAQWCMRVDSSGVLQFDHITRPSAADYTLSPESFEEDINDVDTKNQAKVWGFQDLPGGPNGGSILYQASRTVAGVPDTRTMVYAIPELKTLTQAQSVAESGLDQWASLENKLSATVIGNPNMRVGQSVGLVNANLKTGTYLDTVTDLRSTLNDTGYNQELTAGRRSYRFNYWPTGGSSGGAIPPGTVIWSTSGSQGYIQRIIVGGGDLYMIGNWTDGALHPLAKNVRVEKRSIVDGSILWGANFTTAGAGLFGGDVVFDSAVYACMSGTAGIGSVASIEKLDASTGAIINTFSQSIGGTVGPNTNPMAQDSTDLFMGVGSVGTRKVNKSTLAGGTTFGTYLDQSIEANSNFFILDDGDVLRKSDKTSGYTTNSSALGYPLIGHEISLTGQKVYRLIGNQIGVGGPWEVRRFSVGALASDSITQDWAVSGPNNDLLSGGAWKRGIQAGDTKLVIGMNYLYTAFLSLVDGSVVFDVTGSANSTDYFSSCVQSGGVCYSAGAKNGQWYVEARACP